MKSIFRAGILFCTLSALSLSVNAGHHGGSSAAWELSSSESKVAYGSIKKESVGEVNHFKSISGVIDKSGKVSVEIDLTSVETNIGIRNQRMIKHVFGESIGVATLNASLDMKAVKAMAVGATAMMEVDGALGFQDKSVKIKTMFFVARLGESRFVAVTDEMIMLKTETLGVNAGVDKLMELAALPSITRVAPVSLRLVFEMKK